LLRLEFFTVADMTAAPTANRSAMSAQGSRKHGFHVCVLSYQLECNVCADLDRHRFAVLTGRRELPGLTNMERVLDQMRTEFLIRFQDFDVSRSSFSGDDGHECNNSLLARLAGALGVTWIGTVYQDRRSDSRTHNKNTKRRFNVTLVLGGRSGMFIIS